MAAPVGPCEWCGGPQLWTVVLGEVWVSCKGGCAALPGLEDPLPAEELARTELVDRDEGLTPGVWWA